MGGQFFVYILASKRNGTLYIGVTNNLARRLAEHKAKLVPGFTRHYGVDRLVYFGTFESILEARAREHSLKRWRRAWKIELIEQLNPDWRDLSSELNSCLVSRTRCSVLHAAPLSRGPMLLVCCKMGPGSAAHRQGALRRVRDANPKKKGGC